MAMLDNLQFVWREEKPDLDNSEYKEMLLESTRFGRDRPIFHIVVSTMFLIALEYPLFQELTDPASNISVHPAWHFTLLLPMAILAWVIWAWRKNIQLEKRYRDLALNPHRYSIVTGVVPVTIFGFSQDEYRKINFRVDGFSKQVRSPYINRHMLGSVHQGHEVYAAIKTGSTDDPLFLGFANPTDEIKEMFQWERETADMGTMEKLKYAWKKKKERSIN